MEHQFMAPHRVEHFFEYWFGVNKMGGAWNEATRDAALRIKIEGNRASLSISANERFDQAELIVASVGKQIQRSRVDLDPVKLFSTAIDLPAELAKQPISVMLRSKDGRILINYR